MKNPYILEFEYYSIDVNKENFFKIREIKLVQTDDGHKEIELDFDVVTDITKDSGYEVSDSQIKIKKWDRGNGVHRGNDN